MSEHLVVDPERVRRVTRNEFLQRVALLVIAAGVIAGLVLNAVQLNEIRSTQQNGSPVVQGIGNTLIQVRAISAQIKSCVTPEGQCFKDGQQRTGAAVQAIADRSLYSALCAFVVNPTTITADAIAGIRRCMTLAEREDPLR